MDRSDTYVLMLCMRVVFLFRRIGDVGGRRSVTVVSWSGPLAVTPTTDEATHDTRGALIAGKRAR